MLVIGLVIPVAANPAATLTEEQAHEYYDAHRALEQAAAGSSRSNAAKSVPSSPDQARQLEIARRRFEEARADVETAKTSRANLAYWLKVTGAALAILGAAGLILRKS